MRSRITQAAGLVLFIVLSALLSFAQNNIELRVGDVLVGTSSSGQYSVYRSLAPVATISNAGGATAGCGFDASYHPYTTDTTNALVNRWNVSAIQTPPKQNSVITSRSVPGKSVAFDMSGNVYVGQSGGNGCVAQFGPGFTFKQYLPLACNPKAQGGNNSSLTAGTPWMDLSSGGDTIYFTNTSNSILDFAANCTSTQAKNCVSTLAKITPGSTKLYAIRVLTADSSPGTAGDLLVAGGAQIVLVNHTTGSVIQTYTATGETDFEVLTFLPGGTQFVAGSPANHKLYVFNFNTATPPAQTISNVTGGPTGACTYGLPDAAQPPVKAGIVLSSKAADGVANLPNDGTGGFTPSTAAFLDPFTGNSKLKVTFNNLGGTGTLTARVTQVPAGSVLSDPIVTASYSSVSEGGSFPCTSDGTSCYIWEIEPSGITFDSDDVSQSQTSGIDPNNSHLVKNSQLDITTLTGNADPAGHTTVSVYSINNFTPNVNGTPSTQVVCSTANNGYTSPVVAGQTYNFGSVVPFKFETAASQADCAAGNFLTNLGNTAYLTIILTGPPPPGFTNTTFANLAPPAQTIDVSGNSGTPPLFRLSAPQYILNVDSSNLVPGMCYVAQAFAPALATTPTTSLQTTFCLSSK